MMWNCGWENGKLFLEYFVTYKQSNRGDRRKEWKTVQERGKRKYARGTEGGRRELG